MYVTSLQQEDELNEPSKTPDDEIIEEEYIEY